MRPSRSSWYSIQSDAEFDAIAIGMLVRSGRRRAARADPGGARVRSSISALWARLRRRASWASTTPPVALRRGRRPSSTPHMVPAACIHASGASVEAEVGERASHGFVHRGLGVDHRAVEVEHDRRREHGDEGIGQPYEVRSPHMSAHGRLGPAQTQMGTPCSSLSAPTPLSTCAATLQPFQYVST